MNVTDLFAAARGAHYLAAVFLVTLYARKLVTPASRFPVTLSAEWRPAITAAIGFAYGAVSARHGGAAWDASALLGGALAGVGAFLDGFLVAVLGSPADAPAWARVLVLADAPTAGGSSSGPGDGGACAIDIADRPTNPDVRFARRAVPVLGAVALAVIGNAALLTAPARTLANAARAVPKSARAVEEGAR